MYRFINVGPYFHIPVYNLCIGVGIVCAMLLLQYNTSFKAWSEARQNRMRFALLLAIITGFACAYLFDAFTQGQTLSLLNGRTGLTLMGGMLGGMAVLALVLRLSKIPVLPAFNMLTPSFAIAHFFGRLGCFFGGCCFGKPTHLFPGVHFPAGSLPYQYYHADVAIHPTQLYEAFFALGLCLLLIVLKPKHSFAIYMLSYGVFRFLLEYVRNDDRGAIAGGMSFSPSQVLSLVLIVVVGVLYIMERRRKRKIINNNVGLVLSKIEDLMDNKISTRDFCDKMWMLFDISDLDFTEEQERILNDFAAVYNYHSANEEDHEIWAGYTTTAQVMEKAKEAYVLLKATV